MCNDADSLFDYDNIFAERPSTQLGDGCAVVSRGDDEGPCSEMKMPMSSPVVYLVSIKRRLFVDPVWWLVLGVKN